jgi:hypothetical protein
VKTIWKYTLDLTDVQIVEMPYGATILTAQMQGQDINLWAEVEPDHYKKTRWIWICDTGNPVPDKVLKYISTVQMDRFVWHIYEGL